MSLRYSSKCCFRTLMYRVRNAEEDVGRERDMMIKMRMKVILV